MKIERCEKESFVVIGKEGSTLDGAGFIQRLWDDANSHFEEVQHLAKKDENGKPSGIWGNLSALFLCKVFGQIAEEQKTKRSRK